FLVALEAIELLLLRRYEQLEQHPAATFTFQVVGEATQARRLPLIENLFAFRVVAHQNLAKRRVERFDMRRELLAVLKLELFLSALLGRSGRRETVCRGVTQNSGAKLFVDQDARLLFWDTSLDRGLKAVVDDLLRGRYFLGLCGG